MDGERRHFLQQTTRLAAGALLAVALRPAPAGATPEMLKEAMRRVLGDAEAKPGRITLDLPPLVENGNAVPMTVAVESPMTAEDHVVAIHVFNEKNPQPHVVTARLGPRAGRAWLQTRIKLADAQRVVALAEMKDGSVWSAEASVIVTIAACIEDVN